RSSDLGPADGRRAGGPGGRRPLPGLGGRAGRNPPPLPMTCYDEFALLPEQARELGLRLDRPPAVRREHVEVAGGRRLSALVWGRGPAELVLLHGGAQNAHTWDSVALVLDRPLVAVDLSGHGHSDWREDCDYTPGPLAADAAVAVRSLAPAARAIVGMSIGGVTGIA